MYVVSLSLSLCFRHTGVLIKSARYPISNTPGFYPPNFFALHSGPALLGQSAQSNSSRNADDNAAVVTDPPVKTYVMTRSEYTARMDAQLSFSKGDVIEVVSAAGTWHLGRLVKAQSHPITGEAKRYPSNFVRSVNYNPDTETVES